MTNATDRKPRFELACVEDPHGILIALLPAKHEHHRHVGHVYVIELSNGIIKVGKTANPFKRIKKHAADAAPYGFKVVKLWLSIAHRNPAEVEKLLIGYGQQSGSARVREEYFLDLDFGETVRFANSVAYQPIDLAEIAEAIRLERERSAFKGVSLAEDVDLFAVAQNRIAHLFGRKPDGSYDAPIVFKAVSSEKLRAVLGQIAEVKGCPIEDVLDMTWLDMLEGLVTQVVRNEAMKLQAYALASGHMGILETTGDSLAELAIVEELQGEASVGRRTDV